MQNIYKVVLISLFFLGAVLKGYALEEVTIGNLTYYLFSNQEAAVCSPEEGGYSGDIVIPPSVTYNGKEYTVTKISSYAFCYERTVTSVSIPNTVKEIGINAFLDCWSLKTLTIPESVTEFGNDPFGGCTLNPLVIKTKNVEDYSKVFSRLKAESVVCTYESEIPKISPYYHNVQDLEAPYRIDIINTYIKGVKFKLMPNIFQTGSYKVQGVTVNGRSVLPDDDSIYFAKGLDASSIVDIDLICGDEEGASKTITTYAKLKSANARLSPGYPTHTTMTYYVSASMDETAVPISANVCIYNPSNQAIYSSENMKNGAAKVVFTGLWPGVKYSMSSYRNPTVTVEYEDGTTCNASIDNGFQTREITVKYVDEEITPTTYHGRYELVKGDYQLNEIALYVNRNNVVEEVDLTGTNEIYLSGLDPDTRISFSIAGTSTTNYVQTTPLKFTMLQPKCVSSTCAIVAAETNISDEETNIGFQWKKYDAPESLAPKEAYAAIYDGVLEGYLKNLQSTSYYNVRAFYKTKEGRYYYSDWVTFDPSDFSYFDPTVHTYPIMAVTGSTATVRGYVLAGTEDITEQGFEYWKSNGGAVKSKLAKKSISTSVEDIYTVLASGQVMQVVLDGLEPTSTYICRAFVRTESGTIYGEEQVFTTDVLTGLDKMEVDKNVPEIIGYYDLSGRRLVDKQCGLNIIRYSDGTSRKIIVK